MTKASQIIHRLLEDEDDEILDANDMISGDEGIKFTVQGTNEDDLWYAVMEYLHASKWIIGKVAYLHPDAAWFTFDYVPKMGEDNDRPDEEVFTEFGDIIRKAVETFMNGLVHVSLRPAPDSKAWRYKAIITKLNE